MRAYEVTQQSEPFADEQEGIALVNRRIAQIQQLRARLQQLAAARRIKPTTTIGDQMAIANFRLYEAKFRLHQLWVKLQRLRDEREQTASSMPKDARTAAR